MRVACVQLDIQWEDKAANFARVRSLVAQAALPAGTLVLLPEMFATGFSMNVAGICESPEKETSHFLAELARSLGLYVLGGLVRVGSSGKGRNEAALFGPDGGELARYCKLHPFSYGGETQHYEAGTQITTVRCGEMMLAPFICYDLRFAEGMRVATRRGAQLLCFIANWPRARDAHWQALVKARAIENQCYVAAVNRCGRDPKHEYAGRSQIIDPRGEILADGGAEEGVIQAELDRSALEDYRREFPALQDMRDDLLKT